MTQIHATYREMLYSPVPPILSSHISYMCVDLCIRWDWDHYETLTRTRGREERKGQVDNIIFRSWQKTQALIVLKTLKFGHVGPNAEFMDLEKTGCQKKTPQRGHLCLWWGRTEVGRVSSRRAASVTVSTTCEAHEWMPGVMCHVRFLL